MEAVIYCRISRDPSHQELGVQRQLDACRKLAAAEEYTIAGEHTDDDRSAYSGKRRPGYEAMKEQVESGAISAVIAWHPDRLTRQPRELEDLIDLLERSQTTVRTVQTGLYDLSTPAGRMSARIVGSVARYESEHKSARLRAKHEELAGKGKVSGGGSRPYGFADDRIGHVEAEADVIREAVRRVIAGESIYSIVNDFTARGITSAGGVPWRPSNLRTVIKRPRYAGLRSLRGKTTRAEWEPIIDEVQHRRVVAILDDPARRKNRERRAYLLSGGLAVCGLCGSNLFGRPRGDHQRGYVCASGPAFPGGCGKIRRGADDVEALVVESVLAALEETVGVALGERAIASDAKQIDRLAALDARLIELGELWAEGAIDAGGWRAARDRLEAERTELVRDVKAAGLGIDADDLRARWPEMTITQRRTVLDAVLGAVVIHPAVPGRNVFDPSKVELRWRV